MKATLRYKRDHFTTISTIGSLFIDGEFFCYGLEDVDRDLNKDGDIDDVGETKVFGETAIPSGVYTVILSMSKRFKRLLPEILNVKGFSGVRIHSGNNASHSHGCILVGYQRGDDFIGTSKQAEKDLVAKLKEFSELEIIIE